MRMFLVLLLGVVAAFSMAMTTYAEEYTTFYLEELDMEVTLPAEFLVITRDNIEGNPVLDLFGYSPERALEELEEEGLYLNAMDESVSFQLMLSVAKASSGDFRAYSDRELQNVLDGKRENYTGNGGTWISGSVLKHDQAVFLKIDFSWNDGAKTVYVREYYTVGYGKSVNLTLNSYTGSITEEMDEILERMVKELRFGDGSLPQEPENTTPEDQTPEQQDVKLLTAEDLRLLYLEEADLEIAVPDSYVVFTRDLDPNDPNLARMDFTWQYMTDVMEDGYIYLDALTPDKSSELLVMMMDFPYGYLNDFSESLLQETIQGRRTRLEGDGMTWISSEIYEHHQARFLKINYSYAAGSQNIYVREYYTLYADKVINIGFNSFSGELSPQQEAHLKQVIDSIHFGTEPPGGEEDPPLALQYEDDLTGIGFTLPVTWKEVPVPKQNRIVTAKFTTYMDDTVTITYSGRDLYNEGAFKALLPDLSAEKRSDVGHELLTAELVAELIECDVSEITATRYGDRDFFRIDWNTKVKQNGVNVATRACTLVRCENGYLYVFQFVGDTLNQYFPKFQKMVARTRYPDSGENAGPSAVPETESGSGVPPVVEHRDELSGTVFPIPEGWVQMPVDSDFDGVEFSPSADPETILLISCADVYTLYLESYEEEGTMAPFKTRAEFDMFFSGADAADALVCEEDEVHTAQYGDISYYYREDTLTFERQGGTYDQPVVYLVHIENGILYYFQFYGEKDGVYYKQFEQMLALTQYTHADAQDVIDAREKKLWARFSPVNLLLSLILTVTVYSLPLFVYRWVIRRYPVERRKAKIITIVYAVFAFVAMIAIQTLILGEKPHMGGAIYLWSWINYRVLIGGKDTRRRTADPAEIPAECDPWERAEPEAPAEIPAVEPVVEVSEPETAANAPETEDVIRFCRNCGFELLPDSAFCSRCGTRVRE